MLNKQKTFQKTMKGFSLMELMIVLAIIGLLSAIAATSYREYIMRTARVEAMDKLNEIMSQQQRYVLRQRTYAINLALLGYPGATVITDNGLYSIGAGQCVNPAGGFIPINRCVLLTAQPQANTTQFQDGAITLNSNRQKFHDGRVGWYQQD